MPTLGLAIPCYHGHIPILKALLDNIEQQTRKPDMVVVSCSGVAGVPYRQEDYSYSLKFITTEAKQSSATNRNIAAANIETDIICFFDADDLMHPQRLEIIEKAFSENDIVMFLHNFIDGLDKERPVYDITNVEFDINQFGVQAHGYAARHLTNPNTGIHNGHCSILRTVDVKYNESPSCYAKEDSVFTADIIRKYPNNTGYCPLPLSYYKSSGTFSFVA
jgi:glycosyltransferase involved in cell wall biosynthesis